MYFPRNINFRKNQDTHTHGIKNIYYILCYHYYHNTSFTDTVTEKLMMKINKHGQLDERESWHLSYAPGYATGRGH